MQTTRDLGSKELFSPFTIKRAQAVLAGTNGYRHDTLWYSQGRTTTVVLAIDAEVPQRCQDEAARKRGWELVDDSEDGLREINGHDLGSLCDHQYYCPGTQTPLTAQTNTKDTFLDRCYYMHRHGEDKEEKKTRVSYNRLRGYATWHCSRLVVCQSNRPRPRPPARLYNKDEGGKQLHEY
eukprot:scaffold23368_cov71-Skeletonema_dohrnii-CCMP3373.AAC.3